MIELIHNAKKASDKLKIKFDDVAIKMVLKDSVMVKIWNNQISVTQSWRTIESRIYLAKDKRILELSLSLERPEDIVKVCDEMSKYVGVMKESEIYAPLPEPTAYKPLKDLTDVKIRDYMDNPLPLVEGLIGSALDNGAQRVAGTLELSIERKALVTSKGFEGEEEGSEVMCYLRAFKGDVSGHWAYGSRRVNKESIEYVGRRAAEIATLSKGKVSVEPGKYDVILSPLVVGNLLNDVAMMASGLYIMMGFSMFMKFKIGDVIASGMVSLYDVPRNIELARSTSFDDEGIETYDKPIIEGGKFTNILHNVKTSSKLGGKTTGNAGWITPLPWNIELKPGDYSEEELIREVRRGLLMTNNWYTRLQNYVEGQFSTVSKDAVFYIENGEIKGYTERIRIADTFVNLLRNVRAIGKTQYLIRWWEVRIPSKVPYLLATNVNITKPYA